MNRLLYRLEKRFGKYALGNLTYYLIAAQAIVFLFQLFEPGFTSKLVLETNLVREGEFWRLISWVFIPPSESPFWIIFALYWLYWMGTALESHWGAFRYQLYWILGIIGTTLFSFFLDVPATNSYLLLSLFFAFATLWPDYQLMIFFVLPVRIKWLALFSLVLFLYGVGLFPGWKKGVPLLALGNYLLFFSGILWRRLKNKKMEASQSRKFSQFKQEIRLEEVLIRHRCTACGVDDSNTKVDFRFCDCDKCGEEGKEFCSEHLWNH